MKESSRQIAKAVHGNPLIAFSYLVDQIKSYDNLIEYVVDAFRYMNELDRDVAAFSILAALSGPGERVQADGITISKWLQSLANLVAATWKRHSLDFSSIVKYIACQLADDNVYDLVILQELLCQLTGIKVIGDSTDAQQEALGGGPVLERELSMSDAVVAKKACARFLASLVSQKLCVPIAILLAQQRRNIVQADGQAGQQLKVVAWLYDHVHASLLQFVDFISSQCSPEQYDGLFLDIKEICGAYRVEPEVAFYLLRPRLSRMVTVCSGGIIHLIAPIL